MKPLRSLTVLPGGSWSVSSSLSDGVPAAVMDMVTRGLEAQVSHGGRVS